MKKVSKKKMQADIPKSINNLYISEILPDLQIRLNATVKKTEYLNVTPTHVGMDKINAKTSSGKYFVEFASSSTIHGFNHIVAPHRHPIERCLAVIFITGALVCLIFISHNFWNRFQNEAAVNVLNINSDTNRIRRPTLIICPDPNINVLNIRQVLERHGVEYTMETHEFIETLANMTYENMHDARVYEKVPPEKWLSIMYDLRVNLPHTIFKGYESERTSIVTEHGICIAIRSFVGVYSSYEYWVSDNWTVLPTPSVVPVYTAVDDGVVESITLTDYSMKVAVCDPGDVPTYDLLMPIRQRVMERATLHVLALDSDERLRELKVRQRGCKFPTDGGLNTWPIYTRGMCVMECRMRVIQQKCGCRPFFVRPVEGVPICGTRQFHCIGDLTDQLFLRKATPSHCGCIPNCNTTNYLIVDGVSSRIGTSSLNGSIFSLTLDFPKYVLRRVVVFGFYDFLAAVGGAAGLCLGASVLSFVEIFYFLTLRLGIYAYNIRQKGTKRSALRSRS